MTAWLLISPTLFVLLGVASVHVGQWMARRILDRDRR